MYVPPPLLIGIFLLLSLIPIILPWIKRGMFTWYATISISIAFMIQLILDIRTLEGGGFFLPGSGTFTEVVGVLGFQVNSMAGGEVWRCLTSLFVHLNPLHVMSNLLFFIIFAYALESRMGRGVTIAAFYTGGLVGELFVTAAAVYRVWGENPYVYGVGASGAILGVAGTLLALYPNERIYFPIIIIKQFKIAHVVGLYFMLDFIAILTGSKDNIGHVAHIGGIAGGLFLGYVLQRIGYSERPLLQKYTVNIDLGEEIAGLVKDERGREILKTLEVVEEGEVLLAWLEELGGHLRCSRCGEVGLEFRRDHFRCPRCGKKFKIKRVEREVSHP